MLIKNITNHSIEILAPAKINLFLQVLNKRPDNYHNINSLMQAVTLFDQLKITRTETPECKVVINGTDDQISDNLILKAYKLLKRHFHLKSGIEVTLLKNIPIAAGLAGGSSDCAAAISAMNTLFELGMDKFAMAKFGLELGSDVPFFFTKGQAVVTGKGEEVKESSFPTNYKIVLISPPLSLSTKEGYAGLKLGLTSSATAYNLKRDIDLEGFLNSLRDTGNDFEKLQFEKHPELGEIKGKLVKCGAVFARMSGSGPTIFGVFPQTIETERVCANNFAGYKLYTVVPFCLP